MGGKFFCAGADIEELGQKNIPNQRQSALRYSLFFESIRQSEMISIAAVNGLALGGGCALAAACDMVIASKTAKFGLPEINLGIAPTGVLVPILHSIGTKMTFLLASRGYSITSGEALRMGLISAVVEDEKLDEEARKLALELAAKVESHFPFANKQFKVQKNSIIRKPMNILRRFRLIICLPKTLKRVFWLLRKNANLPGSIGKYV